MTWAKAAVKQVVPPSLLQAWQIRRWQMEGRSQPTPAALKRREMRRYAHAGSIRVLVETGTYLGDTVAASRRFFDRIYSIELDEGLARNTQARFVTDPAVSVLQGDSGAVLAKLLPEIDARCLFWLDAHYSGEGTSRGERDTPVKDEVQLILQHPVTDHVILIDDAGFFSGEDDYPTLDELRAVVHAARPDWVFEVRDDIIRAHVPSLEV